MSKELIEKLREIGKLSGWEFGKLMREAADALEAKAAPVGEREAAIDWYNNADWGNECFKDGVVRGFQAGAAHQRQQAREVVMPDADGSAAQKSFWAGFESASLRLFGTNIRAAWNSYKASDEFARLNKGAGSHE